jgi:L-aminopeptidase/D-esterase-like protein
MSQYSRRHVIAGLLAALPVSHMRSAHGEPGRLSFGSGLPTDGYEDSFAQAATEVEMAERISMTSLDGVLVGHAQRDDRPTGCTVVLVEAGAVAGVDVRGAAPGTRETDLLRPEATVGEVHAILLSGGSAFGLAAAEGVMRFLRGRDVGYQTRHGAVPIVPAAILYDLGVGDSSTYPDAETGFAACEAAAGSPVAEGSVGAGTGATVGKMFGSQYAMKGGLGSAGTLFADGAIVTALMAVNCRGDVRDPASGRIVAGARGADGRGLRDSAAEILAGSRAEATGVHNTTIGVVATNQTLTKSECTHLAAVAHAGLARAITPSHTRFDGDTIFFISTGTAAAPEDAAAFDRLEIATAAAVADSILRAVTEATGLPGYPSARELENI